MRAIDQYVLKNPAHTGCVGPKHWVRIGRNTAAESLNVLKHARPRPVEVGAVLEDDENVGVSEHGLRTDSFHVRSREQGCDYRISDLVLNDVGRTSGPGRVHDDLNVGDVGQRIERRMLQRPDTTQDQEENTSEHEEAVSSAPFNDARNHGHIPPVALRFRRLLKISLPPCSAVIVTCHVPPEPRSILPA